MAVAVTMTSSAAAELPPGFGGTRHLAQIAPLMPVFATAGSPVANCIRAPPWLLPGTGPFREVESEKNAAPVLSGRLRLVSWKSFVLTKYLAHWMGLSIA